MTRWWYSGIWPAGWGLFAWQVLLFALFYETYSYWVHRLLHGRTFSSVHAVHHRSTRVTPWTAYSVHPVEAVLIGITAPLFILLLPLSLGVAFSLHIMGMVFTIFIHSNFQLRANRTLARLLSASAYHVRHHQNGQVNYAFTTALWDRLMGTKKAS
nr:sterol desaturase family protein [Marinicella sp. NBU2979]